MKHYSVILPLLKWDRSPYSDADLLDKPHIKMYTGVEIQNSLMRNGYEIEILDGIKRGEANEQEGRLLDALQKVMEMPSTETILAYRYILKAKKRDMQD